MDKLDPLVKLISGEDRKDPGGEVCNMTQYLYRENILTERSIRVSLLVVQGRVLIAYSRDRKNRYIRVREFFLNPTDPPLFFRLGIGRQRDVGPSQGKRKSAPACLGLSRRPRKDELLFKPCRDVGTANDMTRRGQPTPQYTLKSRLIWS